MGRIFCKGTKREAFKVKWSGSLDRPAGFEKVKIARVFSKFGCCVLKIWDVLDIEKVQTKVLQD